MPCESWDGVAAAAAAAASARGPSGRRRARSRLFARGAAEIRAADNWPLAVATNSRAFAALAGNAEEQIRDRLTLRIRINNKFNRFKLLVTTPLKCALYELAKRAPAETLSARLNAATASRVKSQKLHWAGAAVCAQDKLVRLCSKSLRVVANTDKAHKATRAN